MRMVRDETDLERFYLFFADERVAWYVWAWEGVTWLRAIESN